MEFHYQNGEADQQVEQPITGLGMIRRIMSDVTFQPGNEHDMRSLTGQQVEAFLEPFTAKLVPDNAWRVERPNALATSVRTYLEKRHDILDLMERKEFKQHGHSDLEAAAQQLASDLQKQITPMQLTHTQRLTEQSSGISRAK